jgi:PAS domain S-box-containing protein
MNANNNIGPGTAALKNRAMFIVAFMMVLLSVLFFYNLGLQNKKEVRNISRIFGSQIKKYYDVSIEHGQIVYRSITSRLPAEKEVAAAVIRKDFARLKQLTLDFLNTMKVRYPHLKEINWYFTGKNGKPLYCSTGTTGTPEPGILVGDTVVEGKPFGIFFAGQEGITYRFFARINVGNPDNDGGEHSGLLEVVVDPGQFIDGVKEMIDMEAVIAVKSPRPSPASAAGRQVIREGYYVDDGENRLGWLSGLKQLTPAVKDFPVEVSTENGNYIIHGNIVMLDYNKRPTALVLAAHNITVLRKEINESYYRLIVTTSVILISVFLILYYTFNRMMSRLIARDRELETINQELQQEVKERASMEEELKNHRDHLEDLIAQGTRELEVKSREIEANEMKLRTVTSSIRDAILMAECSGSIIFWNEATEIIFGYTKDELKIKNFFDDIVPTGNYDTFIKIFGEMLKTGDNEPYSRVVEIECRRKNGGIFPAELMVSEVEIQDESNIIALLRDVTLKKEAETQKRIMLRAVEQSSVAIEIADINGIIEYVNPKFCEITGYDRDEVIGKKTNLLKSNFNREEDYIELWETITSGKDWQGELYNRKKNGGLYWDSTLISPIKDYHGNITHFVAVKEDITERKNMEAELLTAKESAEAASSSKGQFLANMSHEIRTPMNAIMGMTELALGTELTGEQREYLELVAQASRSLLKLLNDILDFSKVDAGKLVLEPSPFQLRKTFGDIVKTLAIQVHKKNLELIYYIGSEVPEQLKADVGRLRQIVVNLIGNSIKFTEQGEIVLKIDVLEDGIDNKVLLHFVVSDTGIGIPEDQLQIIFEKFAQADSSSTRKYGGTGLGLAISTKLVELMGGVIWAESPATFPHPNKKGPGSTFHFTALFEVCEQQLPREEEEALAPLKDLSVLVVDDNETNRRFLKEILVKYGLNPETAGSGPEALAKLKREREKFQLMILDFRMPRMDGAAVLKKIRQELHLEIPIILITSGINIDNLLDFRAQNASGHLLKPVNSKELLDAILRAMGYRTMKDRLAEARQEKGTADNSKARCLKFLVAEDNTINQRLVRRMLEKEGHQVDIASDGNEAVENFLRKMEQPQDQYDLILMDIQMPNMDGLEATHKIRQIDKEIPIIALTAHAMKGDKGKFLSQGMDDYLAKPVDRKLLLDTIAKHVQQDQNQTELSQNE